MAGLDARPATARTPLRQLYALYRLTFLLIKLPYWTISALISRPRNWTFKQAVLRSFFRDYVDQFSLAGVNAPTSLEPGKQGDRFKVIDPAAFPTSSYQGPAAPSPEVAPAKVGGTWYPAEPTSPLPTTTAGPVFLWIHGGAFVMGDSRDDFAGFAGTTLLTHARAAAVFCIDYRLSGYSGSQSTNNSNNPFPAAFQDVITAYLYLTTTLRIPAAQITVGGDSAGGNLAIALLRYIEAHGSAAGLEAPASVVLASPWVSPLEALDPACGYTADKSWATDYLPISFLQWGARTYTPAAGIEEGVRAYITPLGHAFATRVPVLVCYGENEILRAGIVAFAEEMRGVESNVFEVFCEKDAVHDTIILGGTLGWADSAKEVAERVGEFVKAHRTSMVK